jgi:hypothetical protein
VVGVYSLFFRITPAVERLYLDELQFRNESEGLAVSKLRKLLMMSLDRRYFAPATRQRC